MTQPFRHHDERNVGRELQRRRSVTQVVHPLRREAGALRDGLLAPPHVPRVHHRPVLTTEHQVVVLPCLTPLRTAEILLQSVRHEHADRTLVEVHLPVLAGLRLRCCRDLRAVVDDHDLLHDSQRAFLEVDVAPAQPDSLAATKTGQRDDLEDRAESFLHGFIEEAAELVGFPRLGALADHLRQLDVQRRVELDATLLHRGRQRRAQRRVDPVNGRRPDRALAGGVARFDVEVQLRDVTGAELVERH
ncbi:MAG TPA: hypothetical protein VG650_13405 [Mycobacteriales bacterium]|nr:hypothetical protein [Mycobacteriales bacterium]